MKHILLLGAIVISSLILGCSDSRIEGKVIYFNGEPAARVEIIARAYTNIKEEQQAAEKRSFTNDAGEYSIGGLLPEKKYTVSVEDCIEAGDYRVTSPKEGTRLFQTIFVSPQPSGPGVWYFNGDMTQANMHKVSTIPHPSIKKRTFYHKIVVSVSDDIVEVAPEFKLASGYLIFNGLGIRSLGRLFPISQSGGGGGIDLDELIRSGKAKQVGPKAIEEKEWFYNVSGFGTQTLTSARLTYLTLSKNETKLSDLFYKLGASFVVISLSNLQPGVYFASPDDTPLIKHGYVFRIN